MNALFKDKAGLMQGGLNTDAKHFLEEGRNVAPFSLFPFSFFNTLV